LLHPRVPPLVRSLPPVELLSLFRAEESLDEVDAREALGLGIVEQQKVPNSVDDVATPPAVPKAMTMQPPPTPAAAAKQIDEYNQTQSFGQPATQLQVTQPMSATPLPLPASPLPSLSVTQISTSSSIKVPAPVQPTATIAPMDEDDEDEEMPTIDMSSDSD